MSNTKNDSKKTHLWVCDCKYRDFFWNNHYVRPKKCSTTAKNVLYLQKTNKAWL